MAGDVKIIIGAELTPMQRALSAASYYIRGWGRKVGKTITRIGRRIGTSLARGLMGALKGALVAIPAAALGGIGKSIFESGRFEASQMQFEALLGSAENAKKRFEEIKKLDLEVPFDITGLMEASRMLTVFSEGALGATDSLRMMADAAAVTPNQIQDVAFWYGRAYSMIKSGRPFGEAAMRLQEMGLLTGKARNEMEKLGKSGAMANQAKILALLDNEFMKFQGAALKMAGTWRGLLSIFTSGTKQAFAAVGDAIMPVAKIWLKRLNDGIQALRENGTLTRWGQQVAVALQNVFLAFKRFYNQVQQANQSEGIFGFIEAALRGLWEVAAPAARTLGVKLGEAIADGLIKGFGSWIKSQGRDLWNWARTAGTGREGAWLEMLGLDKLGVQSPRSGRAGGEPRFKPSQDSFASDYKDMMQAIESELSAITAPSASLSPPSQQAMSSMSSAGNRRSVVYIEDVSEKASSKITKNTQVTGGL